MLADLIVNITLPKPKLWRTSALKDALDKDALDKDALEIMFNELRCYLAIYKLYFDSELVLMTMWDSTVSYCTCNVCLV